MPVIDSEFFEKKGKQLELSIVLENRDDVLQCLARAMNDNRLDELKIFEGFGKVTNSWLTFFEGNKFKSRAINGEPIVGASAFFKRDKKSGKIEGDLHLRVAVGNQRLTGTLERGKALGELSFKGSFIRIEKE